jgi:hypothetical protein
MAAYTPLHGRICATRRAARTRQRPGHRAACGGGAVIVARPVAGLEPAKSDASVGLPLPPHSTQCLTHKDSGNQGDYSS